MSERGTSSAPWLRRLKRTSGERPSALACARSASTMASCASSSTCFRAVLSAVSCFWHLASKAPRRTFSLTSALRASANGPLTLFFTSSKWPFMPPWPFSISSIRAWRSFSHCSMAESGSSRSAPRLFTRASAAGRCLSACSCSVFAACVAVSTIAFAARLSTASCRRLFSPSMLSLCCFCASATFFFRSCCATCTLLTRGFNLVISTLVSAKGPVFTPRSSSTFWSMYFIVWLMTCASS
mmetsp:Transcript_33381/g.95895  ORF Transcript_33381/g.95895 Transcript_33381/m.95895 type:complete len:240 (+) Transcript_33381:1369-2088(+)